MITPPQPPAMLPPPKKRWIGRRLNRVPAIIFIVAGCVIASAVAYTLHERSVEEARRRALAHAQPSAADASGVLKDAPSGYIKPTVFNLAHATPVEKEKIEATPKTTPDDNGREAARKQAWNKYWDNYGKIHQERFDKRHEAMTSKTTVEHAVAAAGAGAAAPEASAQPASANRPVSGGPLGGYSGFNGYGGVPGLGGFWGGLGQAPQIDTAAQQQKIDFANQKGDLGKNDILPTVHKPPIPNALMAGSYIKMVAENEVNSDVPGSALGRVTESVYNTAGGHCVLIPQGSKIIGHYNSEVSNGQTRLPGVMTRIIFPDGSSQAIGAMEAADNAGSAGWQDQVDRHLLLKFGSAAVAGLFGAAIQLSVPQNSGFHNGYSPEQIIGASLGQQMGELGQEMARQNLAIPNTIVIRAGYPYTIITDKDVIMQPWSCDGKGSHSTIPIMSVSDQ